MRLHHLERVTGIEPVSQPWEGRILPINYTRKSDECLKMMQNEEMAKPRPNRIQTYGEGGLEPTTKLCAFSSIQPGADEGIRTHDLCFTKALLYQLSYIGTPNQVSLAKNGHQKKHPRSGVPHTFGRLAKLIETFVLRITRSVAVGQELILLLKRPLGLLWTHVKYVVQVLLGGCRRPDFADS